MNEFKDHINVYASHWQQHFSSFLSQTEWGDKEAAVDYLNKYWLPFAEYESKWRIMQQRIFINNASLPDLLFNKQYQILAFRGGCLFTKESFNKLKECLISLRNEHFVVIENTFDGKVQEPAFRMKYPANINWEEIASGNYISAMILNSDIKEYWVFGETPAWGKYSASEYESPLNIVGFEPAYSSLFRDKLKLSESERDEIKRWLPQSYQILVK